MKSCGKNKLKHKCGIKTPSTCVFYDLTLPEISKLSILEDCISIEDTTSDTYSLFQSVFQSIDTDGLGDKCLTYETTKSLYKPTEDVILVKTVLLKFEDEICKIKEQLPVTDEPLNLDFKCLVDPCGETITTELQLLQILINTVCELKAQINT